MHEMGVVLNIVSEAEKVARENDAEAVGRLVLQIGELTGVVPRYVQDCYPGAIENTVLAKSELIIEIVPGNGICKECNKVYNLLEQDFKCPKCGGEDWEVLSGRELMIKEIYVS